jgi:hypothetical protein
MSTTFPAEVLIYHGDDLLTVKDDTLPIIMFFLDDTGEPIKIKVSCLAHFFELMSAPVPRMECSPKRPLLMDTEIHAQK